MFTILEIIGKDKFEKLQEKHNEEMRIAGEHLENAKNIEIELVNSLFKEYMNKDERDKLVEQAITYGFSDQKLQNIRDFFEDYNKDKITYNLASDIIEARRHIKEFGKESFFSTISNIVIPKDD